MLEKRSRPALISQHPLGRPYRPSSLVQPLTTMLVSVHLPNFREWVSSVHAQGVGEWFYWEQESPPLCSVLLRGEVGWPMLGPEGTTQPGEKDKVLPESGTLRRTRVSTQGSCRAATALRELCLHPSGHMGHYSCQAWRWHLIKVLQGDQAPNPWHFVPS